MKVAKHKSIIKVAALAVLGLTTVAASVTPSFAAPGAKGAKQGKMHRRGGKFGFNAAKLNLTDAQKAQLKTIRQNARPQLQAIRNNTSLSQEEKRAQLKAVRTDVRNQMLNVLTPAQRQQVQEARAERKEKRQARRADRAENLAQKLNLNATQQSQIQSILDRAKADRQAVRNNTSLSREEKRAQLKTIGTNVRNAIAQVLTPAQRQQLEAQRAERQARRAERRENRQERRQERRQQRQSGLNG